jgi:hypothetical protein
MPLPLVVPLLNARAPYDAYKQAEVNMIKDETYILKLHRPKGVSVKELKKYIVEAVGCWGGQFPTDDPLFYPWAEKGPSKITLTKARK